MRVPAGAGAAHQTRRLVGVAMLAAFAAGCVKHLPPAPTPQPHVPAVSTAAPLAQGHGRLVIDVVDGPTPVHQVRMEAKRHTDGQGRVRLQFDETPSPLCPSTPCVIDPLTGNMLLGFPVIGDDELDVELVHVGDQPTVYRRALSHYQYKERGATFTLGVIATALGCSAIMTGTALLPIGLSKDNDPMTWAGGISLGAGAAAVVLGILAIRSESSSYRPGSAIHFALPPGP